MVLVTVMPPVTKIYASEYKVLILLTFLKTLLNRGENNHPLVCCQ